MGLHLCLVATWSSIWIACLYLILTYSLGSLILSHLTSLITLETSLNFLARLSLLWLHLTPYHCEFPADFYASPVPLFKGYLSEPLTFLCSGGTVSPSKQQTRVLTELTMSALSLAGLVRRRILMTVWQGCHWIHGNNPADSLKTGDLKDGVEQWNN